MSSLLRPQPQIWSWPEFVSYADSVADRAEFIDGQPVLQATGTRDHARAVLGVGLALRAVLSDHGFDAVTAGPWLRIGEDRFLPDVMVVSREALAETTTREIASAVIVVEVLSGSTELRDRGRKWASYRRLPGLHAYLLVDTINREVEAFTQRSDVWTVDFLGEGDRASLQQPVPMKLPVKRLLGLVSSSDTP
ncbi:Uma2 family endonuclease [Pararhodospirillum oryzae]|uniref:Putative restriction endonuclease domain-containing protein n=1 Tax=Pararhodospirillum oryzae TaxID=478448 RepID=A0A512H4L0_9PROT|nr:Uma2 family endonuclease [Pararhodospirillum oryzae]GEO80396.1 hypothetical protein ROR02_05270 [Pararhodospirillum oryzae]